MDIPFYILIPATIVLVPFVIAPIAIRFTMWTRLGLQDMGPDASVMPRETVNYFSQNIYPLMEEGFQIVLYGLNACVPKAKAYFALLVNHSSGDGAMVTSLYAEADGQLNLKHQFVEFSTRFTDGMQVDTGNARELSPYLPFEGLIPHQFPQTTDPQCLFKVHTALCRQFGGQTKCPLPQPEQAVEFLLTELRKHLEHQVKVGYLYFEASDESYRPTWKGAFLMIWKLLWPISLIRRCLRASRNRRLLAELGLEV